MSEILRAFLRQKRVIRKVIAKYRSNLADIDEVEQDVFLTGFALEQREEIRAPDRLLLRLAKHLAIDEARRKINTTSDSLEDFLDLSAYEDERQFSPEDMLNAKQKLLIFAEALACLPPELRRIFVLRRIDGLKYDQIATRLNVSKSTVEKRMAAAMTAFTMEITGRGFQLEDFTGFALPKGQADKAKVAQLRKQRKQQPL